MKAAVLWRRIFALLVPFIFAATVVTHHHDHGEDADHCDFCTTVSANRRRLMPSELLLEELAPGGKPGLDPLTLAYSSEQKDHHTTVVSNLNAAEHVCAPTTPDLPSPVSIRGLSKWQYFAPCGQDPPRSNDARAPPLA